MDLYAYSTLLASLVVDAVEDGGQVCVSLPFLPLVTVGGWGPDALVDELKTRRHLARGSQGLDGQLLGAVMTQTLHTSAGQSGTVRLLAHSPIQVDLNDTGHAQVRLDKVWKTGKPYSSLGWI